MPKNSLKKHQKRLKLQVKRECKNLWGLRNEFAAGVGLDESDVELERPTSPVPPPVSEKSWFFLFPFIL